jgi:hypothetical protein
MKKCGEKVCQFIERYGLIPDGSKVGQPIKLVDQGYITFDASGALVLSDECPPMIPMQWEFEDKIGERLIDVSVKRLKYIRYHNRYVFKR